MGDIDLNPAEQAWLEQRRLEAERAAAAESQERPRRMPSRLSKAHGRLRGHDGVRGDIDWITVGLCNINVAVNSRQSEVGARRGSGPADPTGGAFSTAMEAAERATVVFAHLAGPCGLSGTVSHLSCCGTTVQPGCKGRPHDCPPGTWSAIFEWLGLERDHAGVVDNLMGVSPSSRVAFELAVSEMRHWQMIAADLVRDAWTDAWRAGAENSVLDTVVTLVEQHARRTSALAGQLAGWSGRSEARCACGGGLKAGEKTCGRCRTAAWRERRNTATG